jgi:hypothetical protein
MRHFLSVVLALVLTPLIYVSAGYSAVKFEEANAQSAFELAPAALGLAAAFVAGGLYALLVMARLSPLGPVLAGLAYLGLTIWALFDLTGFHDRVQGDLFGVTGLLHVPVGFDTALLAVPLLATVFSPRRWRRSVSPDTAETASAAPAYGATPGSAAPKYDTEPPSVAPSYQSPLYAPSSPPTYPASSTTQSNPTVNDPDRTRFM